MTTEKVALYAAKMRIVKVKRGNNMFGRDEFRSMVGEKKLIGGNRLSTCLRRESIPMAFRLLRAKQRPVSIGTLTSRTDD